MTYFIEHITTIRKAVAKTFWSELEHDYLDFLKQTNDYKAAFGMTHAKWVR